MKLSEQEVLSFIEENDVKFIKLAFCDVKGKLKIISILPPMLETAFTSGIAIKSKLIEGFEGYNENVYIKPDLDTMCLLPWRPSHGSVLRFFCNIYRKDGSEFECDTRRVLYNVYRNLLENDIKVEILNGLEFYLFKNDLDGNPTDIPFDNAGYMDESPDDKGEDVRRDISLTLEDMNITPIISHHNAGPGQNEVDFISGKPIRSADNVIAYRTVVKNMADRNGLHASFRPKPITDECGNSFRITFSPRYKGSPCPEAFMAGIAERLREITAVLNSQEESYERLGDKDIPNYVCPIEDSRKNLFSLDVEEGTVELISPDSAANPYLAYALLLAAGAEGVLNYHGSKNIKEDVLPSSLVEAKRVFKESKFVNNILSKDLIRAILG